MPPDLMLLGLGFLAGTLVNLRDMPLAAIGLGTALLLVAFQMAT